MGEVKSSAKAKDHLGHNRKSSEDVHRIDEDLGLYIVCDGSRDKDGHWAAQTICNVIHDEVRKFASRIARYRATPERAERMALEHMLHGAVEKACAAIYRASCVEHTHGLTSSAVDAVLFLGDFAISAHIGNTRLYLVRNGKALRMTRDHTYYEEMAKTLPKGSAINPAFKKRLTCAIGDSESVPFAPHAIPMMPGDLLILCSNGVSDYLSEDGKDLERLCRESDKDQLANRLVDWALKHQSDDNITAIVVHATADRPKGQAVPIQSDAKTQLDLLKRLDVFKGIRDDERALLKLQSILTFRHANPGDVIVQQGGPSDEMFVVISGKTDVLVSNKVIAHRGPGDVIGEMGFFDRRLRSATIVASQPTVLMSIQRWDFDALVEQDWKIGYRILEAVTAELAAKLEEISGG